MKALSLILCLGSAVFCAGTEPADPFADPARKKASDLKVCPRWHQTLQDVPVINGRGAMADPEISAKVERGEVVLGSCTTLAEHRVVCSTCKMEYDEGYQAWLESHPPRPFAKESPENPPCTPETLRKILSRTFQTIPLEIAGKKATRISCARWLVPGKLRGETASVEIPSKPAEASASLIAWLARTAKPAAVRDGKISGDERKWEWKSGERTFVLSLSGSGDGCRYQLEWHQDDPR